jgi:glycolate oxidase FAD binding subunit
VVEAYRAGRRLRVEGAASKPWMAGFEGERLSLTEHRGVVTHDPTELVVTVRAGTPLAELDAALAEQGQYLAAECPDFAASSTIGGALATGWSGSRRPYAGSLRDAVLGCRMINGEGEILRFGGQVMKNVAGYDVSRLLAGSLGGLGPVLELSMKVLPRPEAEITLEFERGSLGDARRLVHQVRMLGEPLSGASYLDGTLRLRISGREQTLQRLSAELGGGCGENHYWQQLRGFQLPFFQGDEQPLYRLQLPVGSASPPLAGTCLYDWGGELCWYRGSETLGELETLLGSGRAIAVDRGPLWEPQNGDSLACLQQRVREAFDPARVFLPVHGEVA